MARRALPVLFLLFLWIHCAAWGTKGRQLVVEIARGLLDQETIALVDHYIGTSSWGEAAAWLETSATPRNAETRKQWRMVLVPKDQTYVATRTPNLINQIEYQLMVLEKRSLFPDASVGDAIKTLFALVADAHQPLRCGYPDDQGGASAQVSVAGKNTTLLSLWDNELLELRKCDMWDCSRLIMKIEQKERTRIETSTPQQWVQESRMLLNEVYGHDKGIVTDQYLDRSTETAKLQLVKAGLRLAALLNRHFNG